MIRIITLHSIINPGSALQAYALNRYLLDQGYENEIIDYRPIYSRLGNNYAKALIKFLLYSKNKKRIWSKYDSFIRDNMHITSKRYRNYQSLEKDYCDYSGVLISGSDQLWNPDYRCGRDDAYKLKFSPTAKKIAYSTSVGKDYFSEEDSFKLAQNLSEYNYLAVREHSTSVALSKVLGRPVRWVCDPVFLLEKQVYIDMCKPNNYGLYAVMYLSEESSLLDEFIKFIRSNFGWKIIQVGGSIKRCECDILINDADPYDFISLIYHSQLVISSSFHATAFCHIMEKNFVSILPPQNGDRIWSLLNLSGLTYKILSSNNDFSNVLKDYDYNEVRKKISSFIEQSKEYLHSSIAACQ